ETTSYHTNTYYNTGLIASAVTGVRTTSGSYYYDNNYTSTYRYDADGNRTFEGYNNIYTSNDPAQTGLTFNNAYEAATVGWDTMNRMTSFNDANSANMMGLNITWQYDLNSNIRNMHAVYHGWSDSGTDNGTHTQDYWYKYDAMNRFVLTEGILFGTPGSG